MIKAAVKAALPEAARRRIRLQLRRFTSRWPPVGWVRFGSFRRRQPIDRSFGVRCGQPIDRYYIDDFLARYASEIQGAVLEVSERFYTTRFGRNILRSEVLHVTPDNPQATIVADLTCADQIPSDSFDCIILTQTLQCIYDLQAAVETLFRIVKPGGSVLATLGGITHISGYDRERWGEYWRFTDQSASKLFTSVFPQECVTVHTYGNILAAVAFLHGLVSSELRQEELEYLDPEYPVLIGVRAVRPLNRVR